MEKESELYQLMKVRTNGVMNDITEYYPPWEPHYQRYQKNYKKWGSPTSVMNPTNP